MNRDSGDEFYVGYLPKAPERLGRRRLKAVLGLNAIAVVLAIAFVLGQSRFAASAFEFQHYRDFEGELRERPYPSLLVARPFAEPPSFSRYWLVAQGKHGAAGAIGGLDGKRVRIRGSLIYRNGNTMIELAPDSRPVTEGSSASSGSAAPAPEMVKLTGEIVDSKCYFGVMNPGNGKVHRDCAVRCISGGIPPVFVVKDAEGRSKALVLTGSDGRQLNREVLDFVAEPIALHGQLVRSGDTLILRTEPASFVRARSTAP